MDVGELKCKRLVHNEELIAILHNKFKVVKSRRIIGWAGHVANILSGNCCNM